MTKTHIYEGEMHNEQRHGRGTLTKDNGDCFKGMFSKGAPVVGTATFEDSGKHHLPLILLISRNTA